MTDQNDAAKHGEARKKQVEEHEAATRKRLSEEREVREKSRNERLGEDAKVKPTPTQEENDLAASGVHVMEHEPDGSQEQPPGSVPKEAAHARESETKHQETKPASQQRGAYDNRASTTQTHKPAHE